MEFKIKNNSKENTINLMRKTGYRFLEEKEPELSFIRPIERSGYPRFHIHLKNDSQNNEIIINLHLDQKRPVYRQGPAHNADYQGTAIEKEAQRIKQILKHE